MNTTTINSAAQAGLAVASLFLCAMALMMCASHSRRRWRTCYDSYVYESDPVIQLNNETTFMWLQQAEKDESVIIGGEGGDVSVWRKDIIMGKKCQLPDYSGVIVYDSEGNLVGPKGAAPHVALSFH
ncbi:hypothetical protein GIB67_020455 [Kingdonia uniflora]|uniref:Uncharacterized protein n=1 Tax=Kingdonia uniflora TaxID=39325 RepID=A0A7J7LUK3_9MAGN|nr:hypothetical protein GIB67_020455 [Kingdonia uniflora]